ncbi:MAG: hypothetical protein AMJ78_02905 [Omnitrophica WOR_2 bacterium SM23_29]|nr:MAG: hypothetical protein AMJ78_02905 [Omnitrophica WOR_2 bacterium SM23_29]
MLIEKKLIIKNRSGLHARPAALFVQIANKYDSDITVKKGKLEVNGKSIMGILMLAAERGSQIILRIEGADANKAMLELEKLLSGDIDTPVLEKK